MSTVTPTVPATNGFNDFMGKIGTGFKSAQDWFSENPAVAITTFVASTILIVTISELAKRLIGLAFSAKHEYEKSIGQIIAEHSVAVVLTTGLTIGVGILCALSAKVIAIAVLAALLAYAIWQIATRYTLTNDQKLILINKDIKATAKQIADITDANTNLKDDALGQLKLAAEAQNATEIAKDDYAKALKVREDFANVAAIQKRLDFLLELQQKLTPV